MCLICQEVNKLMDAGKDDAIGTAMRKIETAMKQGVPAEHFQEALDKILGTEMEARDPELDLAWERRYRRGNK